MRKKLIYRGLTFIVTANINNFSKEINNVKYYRITAGGISAFEYYTEIEVPENEIVNTIIKIENDIKSFVDEEIKSKENIIKELLFLGYN